MTEMNRYGIESWQDWMKVAQIRKAAKQIFDAACELDLPESPTTQSLQYPGRDIFWKLEDEARARYGEANNKIKLHTPLHGEWRGEDLALWWASQGFLADRIHRLTIGDCTTYEQDWFNIDCQAATPGRVCLAGVREIITNPNAMAWVFDVNRALHPDYHQGGMDNFKFPNVY